MIDSPNLESSLRIGTPARTKKTNRMKKTLLLIAVLGAGLPTVVLHADDDSRFKDLTTAEALENDSARKAVLHTIETRLGGLDCRDHHHYYRCSVFC